MVNTLLKVFQKLIKTLITTLEIYSKIFKKSKRIAYIKNIHAIHHLT